jgi:hypothetical protein
MRLPSSREPGEKPATRFALLRMLLAGGGTGGAPLDVCGSRLVVSQVLDRERIVVAEHLQAGAALAGDDFGSSVRRRSEMPPRRSAYGVAPRMPAASRGVESVKEMRHHFELHDEGEVHR